MVEICRKMGGSEATFFQWKKVYAGMGGAEIRRPKQLQQEKVKLIKRLTADLTLDETMFRAALQKTMVKHARRREVVRNYEAASAVTERRACSRKMALHREAACQPSGLNLAWSLDSESVSSQRRRIRFPLKPVKKCSLNEDARSSAVA